jgi:hypothetical protein
VEAAVHVDSLSGAEGEVVEHDGRDGLGDVFGPAPTANRPQALGDVLVVLGLHRSGHVAFDDPGADLDDGDLLARESLGE